ncbi:hypothetical protein AX14_002062 [Amanita brunnescens Koide BX004]|nr:hypothetical protein AX14_002062 [Amanita brunnescens Koide BX004]
MLLTDLFLNLILIDLHNHITKLTKTDAYVATIYSCIKRKAPPLRTTLTDWTLDDSLILFKNKVYVPDNLDLRQSILAKTHESPVARHPGHFKMLQLLKEWFYWPRMVTMTANFVEGCATCQQMKPNTHPTTVTLMPIISHATRPFQQVTMDFITDLPISNGFDSIFIMVNQGLLKGVILCPCKKTINTYKTMKLYIDNIFIQFGLPNIIISDRGLQFASKVFNSIFEAIRVKHKMSTAFHPQTDRQTEHYNQELEAYLRIYCTCKLDKYSNKLSLAQFAHNSRMHEALQKSPFELIYRTKPIALPEASEKMNSPIANNRISQLFKSHEEVLAAHELAHTKMKEKITHYSKPFKVNNKVWLDSKNLRIPYQSPKLAPK